MQPQNNDQQGYYDPQYYEQYYAQYYAQYGQYPPEYYQAYQNYDPAAYAAYYASLAAQQQQQQQIPAPPKPKKQKKPAEKATEQVSAVTSEASTTASSQKGKPNALQVWGNKRTMNLPNVLHQNILTNEYFKDLYNYTAYNEIFQEIQREVKHVEPWLPGSTEVPSTAFCLLYKLFTAKLTRRQVEAIISTNNTGAVRAMGFLYVRFAVQPEEMWDFFGPHSEDEQEFNYKQAKKIRMYEFINGIITDQKFLGIMFPRIPQKFLNELTDKMREVMKKKGADKKIADKEQRESKSKYDRDPKEYRESRDSRDSRDHRESRRYHDDKKRSRDYDDEKPEYESHEKRRRRSSVERGRSRSPSPGRKSRESSPAESRFSQPAPKVSNASDSSKIRQSYLQSSGSSSHRGSIARQADSETVRLGGHSWKK